MPVGPATNAFSHVTRKQIGTRIADEYNQERRSGPGVAFLALATMAPIRTVRAMILSNETLMATSLQQWTRLIRFVAAETAQVHIGQPVDPSLDGEVTCVLPRALSGCPMLCSRSCRLEQASH